MDDPVGSLGSKAWDIRGLDGNEVSAIENALPAWHVLSVTHTTAVIALRRSFTVLMVN